MNTVHERLRAARIAAGYETASDVARAFGWGVSTYSGHENGTRGVKKPVAERYASALGVTTQWLLLGIGTAGAPRQEAHPPQGFSEPAVEPITGPKSLKIGSLSAAAEAEDTPTATKFRVNRTHFELGILAGDFLVIDLQTTPRSGDIVVANQIDLNTSAGFTLLGRLVGNSFVGSVESPPIPTGSELAIFGKVRSVLREIA